MICGNWTCVQYYSIVPFVARRGLSLRVRFEPGRLAEQHLRLAYETVVPIRRVQIGQRPDLAKRAVQQRPRPEAKGR